MQVYNTVITNSTKYIIIDASNYTNAFNTKNNTYTWILNRSNCNDSQIILTLNKKNETEKLFFIIVFVQSLWTGTVRLAVFL